MVVTTSSFGFPPGLFEGELLPPPPLIAASTAARSDSGRQANGVHSFGAFCGEQNPLWS